MITTSRCAKWLQHLPEAEAASLLDAVVEVAAAPLDSGPRCKRLSASLFEARVSLPPSRQFRLMFSYRRDGVAVLLSACLKTSLSTHEKAIRAARQELMSPTPVRQESAMPKERPIFSPESGWLYDSTGRQLRIVHMTRKKVVVDIDAGPVDLRRSHLEQDGFDCVNGTTYRLTRYSLPSEAMEHIA